MTAMTLLRVAAFVAVGIAFGAFVGKQGSCRDGTCPLTATAPRGAIWGGLLGLLFALSLTPSPSGPDLSKVESVAPIATPVEFEESVGSEQGVAVMYFHADWCGACQGYSPVFARTAKAQAQSARFYEADTDRAQEVSRQHNVSLLPTTLVFLNGKEYERLIGAVSEETLTAAIRRAVSAHSSDNGSSGKESING